MNILFLTRRYWPSVGGVERHVESISRRLSLKGHNITVLTEKYKRKLKAEEAKNGVKVVRFSYPKVKILGLLTIWFWMWKNRRLIEQSDIVHCHDVFIWYLPFRFLYPKKVVTTTFHGWGGHYPVPPKEIFLVKIAKLLSWRTIAVGKYIEEWYGIKANYITYGGITQRSFVGQAKLKNSIVFVGRLEEDTGLVEFMKWLDGLPAGRRVKWSRIDFVGDGSLKKECGMYGIVHGFTDPVPFMAKAQYCVPGGYLSSLSAMAHFCKIKVFWNNPLKENYWKMTPFYKFVTNEDTKGAYQWVNERGWDQLCESYLKLWSNKL